jgi:predicted O-methyltransferase YrrM
MDSLKKAFQLCTRLSQIAFLNPRGLSHVLGSALSATHEVFTPTLDLLRLPQVAVEDLLPEAGEMRADFVFFPKAKASVSLLEFIALVLLLKRTDARSIFEFGTYKGVSITQLALNAPNARIFTLDLPEHSTSTAYDIRFQKDAVIAREMGKGGLVPPDVRPRITFLKCDSAIFDETPYREQIDFVFVDGAHNMDYVRNDSEKGWRMLRPGGIMVWHDFVPADPDVVRYLLQCPYAPKRVRATSLAFAQKT